MFYLSSCHIKKLSLNKSLLTISPIGQSLPGPGDHRRLINLYDDDDELPKWLINFNFVNELISRFQSDAFNC